MARSIGKCQICKVHNSLLFLIAVEPGAMRAYQDMMYGKTRDDPETKAKWKALLLQYCELDTIAMLVVWACWERALAGRH